MAKIGFEGAFSLTPQLKIPQFGSQRPRDPKHRIPRVRFMKIRPGGRSGDLNRTDFEPEMGFPSRARAPWALGPRTHVIEFGLAPATPPEPELDIDNPGGSWACYRAACRGGITIHSPATCSGIEASNFNRNSNPDFILKMNSG